MKLNLGPTINGKNSDLFSDKMMKNQLGKFSNSEFLSVSKRFNDVLQESNDKQKDEEKRSEKIKELSNSSDLKKYLLGQVETLSSDQKENELDQESKKSTDHIDALLNVDQAQNKDKISNSLDKLLEDKAINSKLEANLNISQKLARKDLLGESQLGDLDSLEKETFLKTKEKGKFSLDSTFKSVDQNKTLNKNINAFEKIGQEKLQSSLRGNNEQLNSLSKINVDKNAAKKISKNISHGAKIDYKVQNELRSKGLGLKKKIGAIKAAKVYSQFALNESNGIEAKNNANLAIGSGSLKGKANKINILKQSGFENLKNDFMQSGQLDGDDSFKVKENTGSDFAKMVENKSTFKAEGMDNLVQNARLLANKGGGELKLLLNPKGLGAVRLKVEMENKQIRIEMLTDTQEARDVIEATMDELRKALADSQIELNDISVDSLENFEKSLAEESKTALDQEAKDFLHEFSHQNNRWRQGMVDFPSVGQRESQVLEDTIGVQSRKNTSSERRLDLVA